MPNNWVRENSLSSGVSVLVFHTSKKEDLFLIFYCLLFIMCYKKAFIPKEEGLKHCEKN